MGFIKCILIFTLSQWLSWTFILSAVVQHNGRCAPQELVGNKKTTCRPQIRALLIYIRYICAMGKKTRLYQPWFGQHLGCSSFRGPSFSHTLLQPAECVCGNVCGKRSTRWRKQRTTRAAGSFEHDTSWYSFSYGAKLETSGCSKRMSSVQSLWNSPCVVLTEHRLYHPICG